MRVKVREEARRVLRYEKKNRRNDVTGIEREREREKGVQDLKKKKKKRRREEGRSNEKIGEKDGREGTRRKTAVKSASEEEEVLADLRAAVAGRALIFVTEY